MRETRLMMNMPISVELVGCEDRALLEEIFAWFTEVERRFSFFRDDSEVGKLNAGERAASDEYSKELKEILAIAQETKRETLGYFDIVRPDGRTDPSGIVKGWAVARAADMLRTRGIENFCVDAGGDIQCAGHNEEGKEWRVGIRNPFVQGEIVKVIEPRGHGVATSGSYIRGRHIYDPHALEVPITDIVSVTVIGRDVLEADRFATAAFAMGDRAAAFIESAPDMEAYVIDVRGIATMTSGFDSFVRQ